MKPPPDQAGQVLLVTSRRSDMRVSAGFLVVDARIPVKNCPLLMLPGVGTDERLFTIQKLQYPELIVPNWLPAQRGETLQDYARRMAASCAISGPCILCGVSFGGIVALEMTRYLDARCCILISSLRRSEQRPRWIRWFGPFAWVMPSNSDRIISSVGRALLKSVGGIMPRRIKAFCQHLSKTKAPNLPWACQAVVSWKSAGDWPCPVYQIHGSDDPIFPARYVQPDEWVEQGGHLLTLTHPFQINRFLQRHIDALTH